MHALGRSCGNRHCPSCQRDKAEAWLENHTDRLLPCPYFLVTFTLPSGLCGRAGLLEQGLEVRLRGLQSFMVG